MKRELFTASGAKNTPERDAELFKTIINAMVPVFDSMSEMLAEVDHSLPRQAYKITIETVNEEDYLS